MALGAPAELEDWLQLASAALSLGLLVVVALAYHRRPTQRTLLLTVGFALFALRGAFAVAADFLVSEDVGDLLEGLGVPLEIGFLVLVVLAFLKA